MYYQALLPNGRPIRLPWQCRSFFTNVSWPLQDNPTAGVKIFNRIIVLVFLFSFLMAFEAAVRFFLNNLIDISLSTEAFANLVIYSDSILRLFSTAFQKTRYKRFLEDFYREIYVDKEEDPKMSKAIQRSIRPIDIYSFVYLSSITTFCLGPIVAAILYDSRLLPHRLEFHYSLDNPLVYGFTLLQLTCNGLCAAMFVTGETCLLGNFVGHLCARYVMLQNQLNASAALTVEPSKVAQTFRQILAEAIRRNFVLNKFAQQLNATYEFKTFVMISHSTIMLCVLIFQASTSEFGSAKFIAYVAWMTAKILELIIYGGLGTKLITTTNNLSSMYYHCNWEAIVYRSTNKTQNVLLMKQISLAILLYQEPIELNGFGFFNVSLETAASLIRGAGSYFTFLTTFT